MKGGGRQEERRETEGRMKRGVGRGVEIGSAFVRRGSGAELFGLAIAHACTFARTHTHSQPTPYLHTYTHAVETSLTRAYGVPACCRFEPRMEPL